MPTQIKRVQQDAELYHAGIRYTVSMMLFKWRQGDFHAEKIAEFEKNYTFLLPVGLK
jgi:hypothetical protein